MIVKVSIEETLVKEVEIECPDNLTAEERLEYAKEKAREMYDNEEIVLTTDDFNGMVLCMAEDVETGDITDWHNF